MHVALLATLVACNLFACRTHEEVRASIDDGIVVGEKRHGIHRYLGIPYAEPPVGELRWLPPRPLQRSWIGERTAVRFSEACVQGATPEMARGSQEDCLYLNVWAPAAKGPHSVMVWIHGGGFMLGSANEPHYDGEELARSQSVVVVSMNYRLTYLGFLSLETLQTTEPQVRGNQGILDQIAALQWIRRNVSAFGGDPENVTIFGESGGGVSVCLLMAAPLARGLFQKAVMQSGVCGSLKVLDRNEAVEQTKTFLGTIGCSGKDDPLRCARSLSPEDIERRGITKNDLLTTTSAGFTYFPRPAVDGHVFPDLPVALLEGDRQPVVRAVLLGTNDDEGSVFAAGQRVSEDEQGYLQDLEAMMPGFGAELSQLYPFGELGSGTMAISRIFTDVMETCPTRRFADMWSKHGDTFVYHFTQDVSSPILWAMQLFRSRRWPHLGTYHGAELPYVFGFNSFAGWVHTKEQRTARRIVMRYWAHFARSGNPNDGELPFWPPYDVDGRRHLELDATPTPGRDLRGRHCAFWDRHGEFSLW